LLDQIGNEIRLEGNLDEGQRQRLLEIATRCPVHRSLSSEIKIRTTEAKGNLPV
jgi:putative redox protein